jgi:hypothetical protein
MTNTQRLEAFLQRFPKMKQFTTYMDAQEESWPIRLYILVLVRWIPTIFLGVLMGLGALVVYSQLLSKDAQFAFDATSMLNVFGVSGLLFWTVGQSMYARATSAEPDTQFAQSGLRAADLLTQAGYAWVLSFALAFFHRSMDAKFFGPNPTGWVAALFWMAQNASLWSLLALADAMWHTVRGLYFMNRNFAHRRPKVVLALPVVSLPEVQPTSDASVTIPDQGLRVDRTSDPLAVPQSSAESPHRS